MKLRKENVIYKRLIEEIDFVIKEQALHEKYFAEEDGSYIITGVAYGVQDSELEEICTYKWILAISDKEFNKLWLERRKKYLKK